MAKKKKKSADKAEKADKADDRSGASSSSSPDAAPTTPAEVALAAGNYAAVRELAKADEKARALLDKVTVDMVQVAVGVGGMIVVIIAAMLTLTGGSAAP